MNNQLSRYIVYYLFIWCYYQLTRLFFCIHGENMSLFLCDLFHVTYRLKCFGQHIETYIGPVHLDKWPRMCKWSWAISAKPAASFRLYQRECHHLSPNDLLLCWIRPLTHSPSSWTKHSSVRSFLSNSGSMCFTSFCRPIDVTLFRQIDRGSSFWVDLLKTTHTGWICHT